MSLLSQFKVAGACKVFLGFEIIGRTFDKTAFLKLQ